MFREFFAKTLREELSFMPCKADPDVWMRKATKSNGLKYWEYILVYVDDVLVISEHPDRIMDGIAGAFTIKPGSMKEPDLIPDGNICSKYFISLGISRCIINQKWYSMKRCQPLRIRVAFLTRIGQSTT